jgi:hypothetical protein
MGAGFLEYIFVNFLIRKIMMQSLPFVAIRNKPDVLFPGLSKRDSLINEDYVDYSSLAQAEGRVREKLRRAKKIERRKASRDDSGSW